MFYFLLLNNQADQRNSSLQLTTCCHSNNNKLDFLGKVKNYFRFFCLGNSLLFFMFPFIWVQRKKKTILSFKNLVANYYDCFDV